MASACSYEDLKAVTSCLLGQSVTQLVSCVMLTCNSQYGHKLKAETHTNAKFSDTLQNEPLACCLELVLYLLSLNCSCTNKCKCGHHDEGCLDYARWSKCQQLHLLSSLTVTNLVPKYGASAAISFVLTCN